MTHGKLGMRVAFKSALAFSADVISRIMVLVGFFLLLASVALFSKAFQYSSLASLIVGVSLIVVGAAVYYESPSLKAPSREGWGTILICISAVLFASAIGVVLYAVPGSLWAMPVSWGRRGGGESILLMDLARPTAWLAPVLFWTAIGFCVFGLLLKFSREI